MKMLAIISHVMMEQQIEEAKQFLEVDSIIKLPSEIRDIWSNINPHGLLPIESLNKVIEWIELNSNNGDYVLVQGDFGATYYVVNYCFKNYRIPIYATTKREANEKVKDDVVVIERTFKHINFRKYVEYFAR